MQLILVNYLFLAFAERCQYVLVPLIYSTSVEIGGLGLTPYYIGLIMGIWSFCNAIVQMNLVGKLIRKCGGARVYRFGYICYLACFLTFPFSTYFARQNGGVGVGSGVFMTVQLFFAFFSTMCYGSCLPPTSCAWFPADLTLSSLNSSCYRWNGSKEIDWIHQWHCTAGWLCHAHVCSKFCHFFVLVLYWKTGLWWLSGLHGRLCYCSLWHRV